MGGLFTFEAMSLLTTVFAKVEPVLLARNLNNYKSEQKSGVRITFHMGQKDRAAPKNVSHLSNKGGTEASLQL